MLGAKRPDIEIVGDEVHPLLKVTDFSPYIAKIKASGADSVITGNWGQDFALLLKAAADAGLQVDWYTYYAGGTGGPTAIKQANLPDRVFADRRGRGESSPMRRPGVREGVPRQNRRDPVLSPGRQRDTDVRQGRRKGEIGRADQSRGSARRDEVRRLRRRQRLHAKPTITSSSSRCISRTSVPSARISRSTRRIPAGAGRRRARSTRRTPSCPPAAR